MESKVPYLNLTDKQFKLIGLTWGLIFAAFYHYYFNFAENQYSIVQTFVSQKFLIQAIIWSISGYILSYYVFRFIIRK